MSITIRLTSPLYSLADGKHALTVTAVTVAEALEAAASQYPALRPALFDQRGGLRAEIRLYRNDESLRLAPGEETPLTEGDQLTLIAPLAAG